MLLSYKISGCNIAVIDKDANLHWGTKGPIYEEFLTWLEQDVLHACHEVGKMTKICVHCGKPHRCTSRRSGSDRSLGMHTICIKDFKNRKRKHENVT
jgi:hypothetical protein